MHCAHKPKSVKQPKWHSLSTSSTACWRWDARATSASYETTRTRDHGVHRLIHATRSRRVAQIEESVARYLHQLDSADRQEPSLARTTKSTRLKEKIAKLKEEMERLKELAGPMLGPPDEKIS